MPSFLTTVLSLTTALFPNQLMYSHLSRFLLLPPLSPSLSSSTPLLLILVCFSPFLPCTPLSEIIGGANLERSFNYLLTALPPIDPPDSSGVPDPTWRPLDWLDIGCVESGSVSRKAPGSVRPG